MLEAALAAGIAEGGGDAWLAGVLPTPAASILVRRHGLDLAAVVSASHNPWQRQRDQVLRWRRAQAGRRNRGARSRRGSPRPGPVRRRRRTSAGARRRARRLPARASSSAFRARSLRARRGARLRQRRHLPRRAGGLRAARRRGRGDRRRARRPQHQRRLRLDASRGAGRSASARGDAEIGFAFDGDGDRVLAVDAAGTRARRRRADRARARHLAATGALERRRRRDGDDQLRLSHGDGARRASRWRPRRSATATSPRSWRARAGRSGGEQSGHIIWTDYAPTGDGIAAALLVMSALGGCRPGRGVP